MGRPVDGLERLTYTVPEAARVLKVSPTQVRRMIAEGYIPILPGVGRRILISRARLAEWVANASKAAS